MSENKLRTQSMDFAVAIINLVKILKVKVETSLLFFSYYAINNDGGRYNAVSI